MGRPFCCRRVGESPAATVYKPSGAPARPLQEILLTLDEFESLRLADLQGLYHEAAGREMSVSRATFGRILETARRKVAEALVQGKAIRIAGGPVHLGPRGGYGCPACARRGGTDPTPPPDRPCRRGWGRGVGRPGARSDAADASVERRRRGCKKEAPGEVAPRPSTPEGGRG